MLNIIILLTISYPVNQTLIGGCIGTKYGCCQDNVTPCEDYNCSQCIEIKQY